MANRIESGAQSKTEESVALQEISTAVSFVPALTSFALSPPTYCHCLSGEIEAGLAVVIGVGVWARAELAAESPAKANEIAASPNFMGSSAPEPVFLLLPSQRAIKRTEDQAVTCDRPEVITGLGRLEQQTKTALSVFLPRLKRL